MGLLIYVNTQGVNDLPRLPSNQSDYTLLESGDYILFSNGYTDYVYDGAVIPSDPNQLTSAGTLITTGDVDVTHIFLADVSAGILKEIHNAGKHNKKHVFCFAFDAATASEPSLELWDDSDMDTFDDYCLGAGVAGTSMFRGFVTTDNTPPGSDNWDGVRLAGSDSSHVLWLNKGAGEDPLTGAKDLYCNLRITITGSYPYSFSVTPCIAIKYV